MKKTVINNYLEGLKNTFIDKAFFVEKLPENIDTIVDYGCADGSFLVFLRNIYGNKYNYIGIERNGDFIHSVRTNKIEAYSNFSEMIRGIAKTIPYDKMCVNFSSSLHEIYKDTEDNLVNRIMEEFKFGAISVRDMNVQIMDEEQFERQYLSDIRTFNINMMNIFIRKMPKKFSEFVTVKPINNLEDIVHFLLKYFYKDDDWIRELNENYLSTSTRFANTLDLCDELGYNEIWGYSYNLPYLIYMWQRDHMLYDFDNNNPWFTTHSQYLFIKKGEC